MPQAQNTSAAEHHEAAAKSHRIAADGHCAHHHVEGLKHAADGNAKSEVASKASTAARAMSTKAHNAM